MAQLATLWIGDALGDIEIASAKSFLRHGDQLTLYTYGPVDNVPAGVVVADAAKILRGAPFLSYRRVSSPALHADLFRYQMIAQTGAIWVDLDIIALRPFDFADDWVFGFQTGSVVNNAVLGLPAGSLTLRALAGYTPDSTGVPPHTTGLRRAKYTMRHWLRGGLALDQWPWGALGPDGLTHFLCETGEIAHAFPVEAFYSVPLEEAARFATPNALTSADIPEDAYALHLWGKDLRHYLEQHHNGVAPVGSFLHRMLSEQGEGL